jgi:hypothetical protein
MGDSMSTIINATTTNGVVIQPDNSGSLVLQTNSGTTAVTIDTSQRAAFVAGTAAAPAITTTGDTNTGIFFPAADTIAFAEGGTESMRIDSSGNLLVGTTTVTGSARQTIAFTSSSGGTGISYIDSQANNTATFAGFYSNVTKIGSITNNGNSATAYNTSSDYRLKENIVPMTGALATISALKPVTYKWKATGDNGQGFIAHELQAVVPDCVTGEKDAVETYTDEEGNEQTRPAYQGVDTSFLVATLTAAIQEMKAIIDAQSVTINDLKARVETLEAK